MSLSVRNLGPRLARRLSGVLAVSTAALLFLCGVLAVLLAPAPLPAAASFAAVALGVACLLWPPAAPLFWLCAGWLCCHLAVLDHLARRQADDERYLVQARIQGIPVRRAAGLEFEARLSFARVVRADLNARLRVRLHADAPVRAGELWQLAVHLRLPRDTRNPGAVDMERNLLRDHVHALGEVLQSPLNLRLQGDPGTLDARRERLAEWIAARIPDRDSAALLAALAVGATGEVSPEQWRVFNATGITHLIAISGMHVTLFAWVAMAAARRAWRLLARAGFAVRRENFAAGFGILCAALYSLLAGFSVPTQRTLIMLSVWLLWSAAARAAPLSQSLGIALIAVLMWDPFAALSAGFWLSFGAVAAIMLIAGGRVQPASWIKAAVQIQAGVTLALVPATLATFGSVSLAGLLVNFVAIPLVTLLLVPLVLGAAALRLLSDALSMPQWPGSGVDALAGRLLRLAAWLYETAWPPLAAAADAGMALWRAAPSAGWYVLAIPGVLVALLTWPLRLRLAATLLLAALCLPRDQAPPPGGMHVMVLDVGQGLAVVVRTAGHALVYDSGASFGSEGRSVERILLPFLRQAGVRQLDVLVLPRLDRDAYLGALALHAGLPPRLTYAGGRHIDTGTTRSCASQPPWAWDGVRLEFLDAGTSSSCVLRVSSGGGSALLTGDLDAAGETALLAAGSNLSSDLVVVPRHAAAGASSPAFIAATQARFAVAAVRSAARQSGSFAAVRGRWREAGSGFLDTASNGALQFAFDPQQGLSRPVASRRTRAGVWRMP